MMDALGGMEKCSMAIIPLRDSSVKESANFGAVIESFVRLSCLPLNLRGLEVRFKDLEKGCEGSATMAEREFGLGVEFGHGFVLGG